MGVHFVSGEGSNHTTNHRSFACQKGISTPEQMTSGLIHPCLFSLGCNQHFAIMTPIYSNVSPQYMYIFWGGINIYIYVYTVYTLNFINQINQCATGHPPRIPSGHPMPTVAKKTEAGPNHRNQAGVRSVDLSGYLLWAWWDS